MMNPRCSKCFWRDQCGSDIACEDYFPVGEELDEDTDERILQRNKSEYRDAWFYYADQSK